ncbi:MAG: UbiD family decarboxylase, partial [Candidatus Binatia bacterium]|nr:UbiD family decarboxylase [Candidatus Binatia bacterium]
MPRKFKGKMKVSRRKRGAVSNRIQEGKYRVTDDGPSLRTWLSQLEGHGQLRRVKARVDWDQEIGALARINLSLAGPGLLFENIKNYQEGRCTKFFTCGMGNKTQVCLMANLPTET